MAKRVYHRYTGGVRWLDDEGQSHREDGPAAVMAPRHAVLVSSWPGSLCPRPGGRMA